MQPVAKGARSALRKAPPAWHRAGSRRRKKPAPAYPAGAGASNHESRSMHNTPSNAVATFSVLPAPVLPAAPSPHDQLTAALLACGAYLCAEASDKRPQRMRFPTREDAADWLGARLGSIWEQNGSVHACVTPIRGTAGGVLIPSQAPLVCIDVDVDAGGLDRNGAPDGSACDGFDDLRVLCAKLGPLPATLVTRSPRGGAHAWFRVPAGVRIAGSGKIQGDVLRASYEERGIVGRKPGLDCKGNGGAYVAEFGHGRTVVDPSAPIAELPPAWLAALPRAGDAAASAAPLGVLAQDGRLEADQNWVEWCRTAPPAVTGEGGGLAVKLLGKEAARRDLRFDSALAVALAEYNPRCEPPFGEREFTARFRTWYDPGEHVESELFLAAFAAAAAAIQAPGFITTADAPPAGLPHRPVADAPDEDPRPSVLAGIVLVDGARPTRANVAKFFGAHASWIGKWRYNELTQRTHAFTIGCERPPIKLDAETDSGLSRSDLTRLSIHYAMAARSQGEPSTALVAECIEMIAQDNRYNPVREYLTRVAGDEHGPHDVDGAAAALDAIVTRLLHLQTPIEALIARRWLISAVARAFEPGCQADSALVLGGEQSFRKSSFFRELFDVELGWFNDSKIDLSDTKRLGEALRGAWCIELAELASMRGKDVETIRLAISSRVDKYRPAYGERPIDFPRATVFGGTVNPDESGGLHFLNDPAGARRFWPITVRQKIDVGAVRAQRDRIWCLAARLYHGGAPWYFEDDGDWAFNDAEADDPDAANEAAVAAATAPAMRPAGAPRATKAANPEGRALVAHRAAFDAVAADPWMEAFGAALPGRKDLRIVEMLSLVGLDLRDCNQRIHQLHAARVLRALGCRRMKDSHGAAVWRTPERFWPAGLVAVQAAAK